MEMEINWSSEAEDLFWNHEMLAFTDQHIAQQ